MAVNVRLISMNQVFIHPTTHHRHQIDVVGRLESVVEKRRRVLFGCSRTPLAALSAHQHLLTDPDMFLESRPPSVNVVNVADRTRAFLARTPDSHERWYL
jgi:hypothetical protein